LLDIAGGVIWIPFVVFDVEFGVVFLIRLISEGVFDAHVAIESREGLFDIGARACVLDTVFEIIPEY
jgi:hypothetical protein